MLDCLYRVVGTGDDEKFARSDSFGPHRLKRFGPISFASSFAVDTEGPAPLRVGADAELSHMPMLVRASINT